MSYARLASVNLGIPRSNFGAVLVKKCFDESSPGWFKNSDTPHEIATQPRLRQSALAPDVSCEAFPFIPRKKIMVPTQQHNPSPYALFLLVLACSSIGCSSRSDIPPLGEVTGTVTLDGTPLEGATVTFAPVMGRPSAGMTDQQGHFILDYAAGYRGALVGTHTVRINTERYVENPDGTTDFFKETIPDTYNSKSTLSADVQTGENQFTFDLSSKTAGRKRR